MIRFIIKRPVAVLMTFTALLMLGIVASGRLPVSLLPDIDIPEITVSISRPDVSTREIENTVVSVLRRNLLQVPGLEDIESESSNGSAIIRISFEYGSDIDLAFMEVNEKIDAAMVGLPSDLERPRIVKASATDIPVFLLNITVAGGDGSEERFSELSTFAETVIRKRIEQLPEVGLADITGTVSREIYIMPDEAKMRSLGITNNDIANAVETNNINIGSILVKDGKYLYSLEFSSYLRQVEDVRDIYIKAGDRMLRLSDVAEVGSRQKTPRGEYYSNGQRAVTLAIIKESSAKMGDLEEKMAELIDVFRTDYPQMSFEISQDQTELLDYSISNLKESLLVGGLLAFLLMFFFLRDGRSPFIIGFSIPTTLIISLLFFYVTGLSINIISLAGLILGIGMMIDNSIVVTENITQWMERGLSLIDSCVRGTNEVVTPLISSVLVTCAVFIPLIFLSGISGALFYDQAIAIVIGQGVSLLVGITLLPTMYYLLYRSGKEDRLTKFIQKISFKRLEERYEKGMDFFFKYRKTILASFVGTIVLMVFLFFEMEKERFPKVRQDEVLVTVDWNENIGLDENLGRVKEMISVCEDMVKQTNTFVGEQQFLFDRDYDQSYTQAKVYFKAESYKDVDGIRERCYEYVTSTYPDALVGAEAQQNIFEKIFSASETPLVVEVSLLKEKQVPPVEQMMGMVSAMQARWPDAEISPPALEDKINVRLNPDRLMLYDLTPSMVYNKLKTSLNQRDIGDVRTSNELVPIVLSDKTREVGEMLSVDFVENMSGQPIPVSEVVSAERVHDYKLIVGGVNGEYVPVNMNVSTNRPKELTNEIREMFAADQNIDLNFSGALITSQSMFREMLVIMLIALSLLYFILAAQFESLTQPLIVLLEIPIDIAGALLLIKICGGTINIMTMIGFIVMSGVIINDSILKVDTMNNLRAEGLGLIDAIYVGGSRRLKPIIMVALSSIFSTLPMLFSPGLGSELQRPMALALVGGMSLGTVVSLFFIPLAYWFIYRKQDKNPTERKTAQI